MVTLASSPLGVAFLGTGQALIVTTTNLQLFNPTTGQIQKLVDTIANIAKTLPVPLATFLDKFCKPRSRHRATDRRYGASASAGTTAQFVFQYTGPATPIAGSIYTSSPLLLPRVSSAANGSYATVGYALVGPGGLLKGRYPNVTASTNITGSAIDSANGVIYAQFPDANQPVGPPTSGAASSAPSLQAAMLIMAAENLTFSDRISIPEDMVGRAVLNPAATVLYAVSESGVMVLPVGALNTYHRIAATQEDILVTTNFCNSAMLSQNLTITDPGGGSTDFTVTTSQPGVTILPATGTTPATVRVLVNPTVVPSSSGTSAIFLTLTSQSAVNRPKPVRLLINNPDPSQRGAIVDQPGVLSDILPDQTRNRVYVLRQDMNQLLVFDGTSLSLITTLRTATSPTMMAMTSDGHYLLVGHDDSQLVTMYDLNLLQPVAPIWMPSSHFARSIAVSNASILALARNEGATTSASGIIDTISLTAGTAAPLPTLGVFANSVSPVGVLTSSPSGANILYASPDGTVALYTATANTFVNSRHDLTTLSGAFAASDLGSYVVGNSILNASLVPEGVVNPSPLLSSGFTFIGQDGYMASTAAASAAGTLVHASLQSSVTSPVLLNAAPMITSEAPLLPTAVAGSPAISSAYGRYGSGSVGTYSVNSFARTVAPLSSSGTLVILSTSGLSVLASSYPASAIPSISAITSAADGSKPVAPGGLVSIYGQNMSSLSFAATSTPLSTALGNSCTGVNGTPIPLLYVSSQQINAQLPFNVSGNTTLTIHTQAGTSNNYTFTVQPTAPSVFMSGSAGPETGLALIFRDDNNQLVTPTNPLHPNDTVTIYLTGMGQTTPAISAGLVAPSSPLAFA